MSKSQRQQIYHRHCINSPNCSCGDTLETPHHYFFLCPQFTQQRNILFSKLKNIIPDQQHFNTLLLLFGSELLDNCNNRFIFQYVHEYPEKTGRFKKLC